MRSVALAFAAIGLVVAATAQARDNPDTKQLLRIVDGRPVWEC